MMCTSCTYLRRRSCYVYRLNSYCHKASCQYMSLLMKLSQEKWQSTEEVAIELTEFLLRYGGGGISYLHAICYLSCK